MTNETAFSGTGASHSAKVPEIFETKTNGTEISWGKNPENPEIVEFPKS